MRPQPLVAHSPGPLPPIYQDPVVLLVLCTSLISLLPTTCSSLATPAVLFCACCSAHSYFAHSFLCRRPTAAKAKAELDAAVEKAAEEAAAAAGRRAENEAELKRHFEISVAQYQGQITEQQEVVVGLQAQKTRLFRCVSHPRTLPTALRPTCPRASHSPRTSRPLASRLPRTCLIVTSKLQHVQRGQRVLPHTQVAQTAADVDSAGCEWQPDHSTKPRRPRRQPHRTRARKVTDVLRRCSAVWPPAHALFSLPSLHVSGIETCCLHRVSSVPTSVAYQCCLPVLPTSVAYQCCLPVLPIVLLSIPIPPICIFRQMPLPIRLPLLAPAGSPRANTTPTVAAAGRGGAGFVKSSAALLLV